MCLCMVARTRRCVVLLAALQFSSLWFIVAWHGAHSVPRCSGNILNTPHPHALPNCVQSNRHPSPHSNSGDLRLCAISVYWVPWGSQRFDLGALGRHLVLDTIKNQKNSHNKSEKNRKIRGLGVRYFYCKSCERMARKLRRIILLHFGGITFRTHFRRTRKPLILIVFGPSGCDHHFQNQSFLTETTK